MEQAYKDVGVPIADRIARMKLSIARLEALHKMYPDLLIKSTVDKDIYQSKFIWQEITDIEILEGSNTLKVLPCKDVLVNYCHEDHIIESTYKIYTDPMEIVLIGYYYQNIPSGSLQRPELTVQVQNYQKVLADFPISKELNKKIEYQLYSYLKKTVLENPSKYKIEFEEHLPERLQTLITFS